MSDRKRLDCRNKCPTDGVVQSTSGVNSNISKKMRLSQLIQASSQNRRLACLPGQTNSKIVFYPITLNIYGRLDTPGTSTMSNVPCSGNVTASSVAGLGQPLNGGTGGRCAAKAGSLPIKNF